MKDNLAPTLIERIFWTTYRGAITYSLNPAQWAALRFFADERVGKKTSSEFAKYHQTTRGTANQTVLALIRRGYLKREVLPSDHRSKQVIVTELGLKALAGDPISILGQAVDSLEPEERDKLEKQLECLHNRLAKLQRSTG